MQTPRTNATSLVGYLAVIIAVATAIGGIQGIPPQVVPWVGAGGAIVVICEALERALAPAGSPQKNLK